MYIFWGAGKGVDGLETARTQKDLPEKQKTVKNSVGICKWVFCVCSIFFQNESRVSVW